MNKYFYRLIILLVVLISSQVSAGQKECVEYQGYTPYPLGNTPNPLPKNQLLTKISPSDLFKYASGYYCDTLNNLPAMYASGTGSDAKITVVGPGFETQYALSDYQAAYQQYLLLLKKTKYLK